MKKNPTDESINRGERQLARIRPGDSQTLLPILQNYLSDGCNLDHRAIREMAAELGLSEAQVQSVRTFYSMLSTNAEKRQIIRLCDGPVCRLKGSKQIASKIQEQADNQTFHVERTSCPGLCDRAPAALVDLEPCGPIDRHAISKVFEGWRGDQIDYACPRAGEVRVTMQRVGRVDRERLQSATELGAYEALDACIGRQPEELIDEIEDSGLQGRGGAGYLTGKKWRFVADSLNFPKYVICNADESEPAVFKDRILMENDPHLLLEGIAIAAYAVGAHNAIIYIRGEYETSAQILEKAIDEAMANGFLGESILGSEFSLHIKVHRGGGAYICGEETALLESLEGRRGEPRIRPPYPTTQGYRNQPTIVNNVETLCSVPPIIKQGASWYRSIGSEHTPGVKLYTLTGHINQPGLFEAPFGITLRQAIEDFGGGMLDGIHFKMALTGGAAGTIVAADSIDESLDFQESRNGPSLGSGSIVVMNDSIELLNLLVWLMEFFVAESCGKCTPCREGTSDILELLEQLIEGKRSIEKGQRLKSLACLLRETSLCGLGQSVAWPLESAIANFPHEFRWS